MVCLMCRLLWATKPVLRLATAFVACNTILCSFHHFFTLISSTCTHILVSGRSSCMTTQHSTDNLDPDNIAVMVCNDSATQFPKKNFSLSSKIDTLDYYILCGNPNKLANCQLTDNWQLPKNLCWINCMKVWFLCHDLLHASRISSPFWQWPAVFPFFLD